MITISIDGNPVVAESYDTILEAATRADIYIPTLCWHPDLPPSKDAKPVDAVYQGETLIAHDRSKAPEAALDSGCGLCVVEIAETGELAPACLTQVTQGMSVVTDSEKVNERRREKLAAILANHPHACLTCAQQDGCSITQCSSNAPEHERCCSKFGDCELQRVAEFVGINTDTPKWRPTDIPVLKDDPLFDRDYNLCIGCTRCVRACRELRGIDAIGFVVDSEGRVRVGTVAPDLKEAGCRFCGACAEVCPTGAIVDREMDRQPKTELLPPCVNACPAGIDIPWYLRLIAEGQPDRALAVIRETVPLPGVLGRVCPAPCEDQCRRREVNEPISICSLKRFAADKGNAAWKSKRLKAPDTGRKVAVVGAGPAGLTAAYYLRKRGHSITIYDSNEKPGGMMRYGIPSYRVPDAVLDNEIDDILEMGIEFQGNSSIGNGAGLGSLRSAFDAVFIAVGAPLSRKIPLDGLNLPQALWGVEFLKKVKSGGEVKLGGKVVVIGGGSVAVDAALTARRLGAEQVEMVCLEDRGEMPANDYEIEQAEEEGIRIHCCWGPMELVEDEGQLRGMCFSRCIGVFDTAGAFSPSFDRQCTMGMDADTIIMAIGQATDLEFAQSEGIAVERNLIKANEKSLETNVPGVFAGGDAQEFAGTIIHAVAAGRRAATAIDRYLGGSGDLEEPLFAPRKLNPRIGRVEGFAQMRRMSAIEAPVEERRGFEEVNLGFEYEDARAEAARCLQCDLRLSIRKPPHPPESILAFNLENVEKAPASEGVFRLMDANKRVIAIKGTENLRKMLLEHLEINEAAKSFDFEEDKMYSKRESELIQRHLQTYGEMPGDADDDDLFDDDDF